MPCKVFFLENLVMAGYRFGKALAATLQGSNSVDEKEGEDDEEEVSRAKRLEKEEFFVNEKNVDSGTWMSIQS